MQKAISCLHGSYSTEVVFEVVQGTEQNSVVS